MSIALPDLARRNRIIGLSYRRARRWTGFELCVAGIVPTLSVQRQKRVVLAGVRNTAKCRRVSWESLRNGRG